MTLSTLSHQGPGPAEATGRTVRSSMENGSECAVGKFALVIPTLCEAENIGGLLDHVRRVLDPLQINYEILVVDDDSNDGTADVVSAVSALDPRVRLLVRKGQRGLSGAILYGWKNTDADVLGVMDADLQHPPELLPKLVAAIQRGRDVAIGSRYTPGGETGSWNPVRKLLSAAAVWVTWPLQKPKARASDPMSGFFMVRRHSVEKIEFMPTGFSCCWRCWCGGRLSRLKRCHLRLGCGTAGRARPTSRWAGIMRGC